MSGLSSSKDVLYFPVECDHFRCVPAPDDETMCVTRTQVEAKMGCVIVVITCAERTLVFNYRTNPAYDYNDSLEEQPWGSLAQAAIDNIEHGWEMAKEGFDGLECREDLRLFVFLPASKLHYSKDHTEAVKLLGSKIRDLWSGLTPQFREYEASKQHKGDAVVEIQQESSSIGKVLLNCERINPAVPGFSS